MRNIILREMSIDTEEFLRLLPKALNGLPYRKYGNEIHIRDEARSIRISVTAQLPRIIATLELPVTRIVIALDGFMDVDLDRFMRRFDLAYQKGGG